MNVKQTLILLGGIALLGVFGYLTASGEGIHGDELWPIAIIGVLLTGSIGGLVYAFRDQ